MKKKITLTRFLSLAIVLLLVAGCATQKSRNDQSKISQFYHDMTSKYNGWFNANELVEESILQLEAQHSDNYNEILDIYKYRSAPNPEAVAASLDTAIKKVSVVVTLHENSQWSDDCYLLIGKAFYLKQDFESAQNALEFFMDEFHPDGSRITKKARRKNPNASKSRTRASIDSARKKSAAAKAAERERKQYNKQVRKNKKQSARKGEGGKETTARKTARDAPAISLEAQQAKKAEPLPNPYAGEENPGGMKHIPAHQEAQLWLARTYVDRENFPGVERILNGLKGNPNLQDKVREEMPKVWAFYSLKRQNYAGAIPHLDAAIEAANKKPEKARLAFIKAQVAEKIKDHALAVQSYEQVLDNNPDYTLDFNARLNLARAKLESGAQSSDEIANILEKMLKDEKNVEFKDQIYFMLAQLELRKPDVPAAIANLQLAADNGAANQQQLTETNFLLAELYFQTGDYVNAKGAYDAVLTTMPKSDPRYRQADRLSKNLSDIAKYLSEITLQDSLLVISTMTDDEKMELAKKLRKSNVPQGKNGNLPTGSTMKGGNSNSASMGTSGPPSRPTGGISAEPSTFFAYNQKELKRGQREFMHDWGERRLGDNWRLASLSASNEAFADEANPEEAIEVPLTSQEVSKILRDVPDTDEKKAAAHETIQNAMLQLGSLYRDKLEYYDKSIDVLDDLLTKYPDTKFLLDAYYQLYVSHIALGNIERAEYYKNKIVSEYASSKYALVLTDPDYLSKQLSEEQRLDRDYQAIYQMVENGEYGVAKEKIDQSKQTFGTSHKLFAKYSIMEAMCIGNLEGKEAYIDALKAVIGGFPGTPEETKARDMLLLLGEYQGSRLNLSTNSGPTYEFDPAVQHFILVQVGGQKDSDAQDIKVSISNYNRKYHSLDKLKISSLRFDAQGDKIVILVRSFDNAANAMKYFDGAKKNSGEFVPAGTVYEVFAVSQENYRDIVAQKSVESYRSFFEEHYKELEDK